jgi:hypothetical protein
VTVVPAVKSAPIVAVSKLSRLTSIRSPVVLEEAIVNALRGTVVDRFAVEVGAIVQIDPTAHVPMAFAVSFSIVSDGFAKVSVTDV